MALLSRLPGLSASNVAHRFLTSEYFLLNVCVLATYYLYREAHVDYDVDLGSPLTSVWKVLQPLIKGAGVQLPNWVVGRFSSLHSAAFTALESQVAASLVLTAVMRSYKSSSVDAMVATLVGYCQGFVLINSALTDAVACTWYLLAFIIIFLLFNEPSYTGASNVDILTPALLQEKCLTDNGDGVAYAVFMHTSWSSRSRHAYPVFAELSQRFATDKLKFGRLDIGLWPVLARQLNLDLSAVSSQLPTVILFEGGQAAARVPAGSKASLKGVGKWTFSKVELISALQLDARYARTMTTAVGAAGKNSAGAPTPAEATAAAGSS